MTTPTWPESLPQYMQEEGYGESAPDQSIESPMDSGPPKTRRRFTGNYRPVGGVIRCDADQFRVFELFYYETLAAGTKKFWWVNPLNRNPALMRFRKPVPAYTSFGGANVAIRMSLWQMREYTLFTFDSDEITFDSTEVTFDMDNRF